MTRPDEESSNGFEALQVGDDVGPEVGPSRERFDRAARAGRRRRRLKVASLATGSAVMLFVVGAATLLRDTEPDRLVVTDRVVAPPTEPTTTEPSSLPTSPVAPTIPPPTTLPGPEQAPIESPSDEFVTVSGGSRAVIDVRNAVDVVASFDLTCPIDRECTVQSARTMGDTIWVAVTESESDDVEMVVRSRVVSVSRSTGETVEHLSLDGTSVVLSAGLGANGVLYAYLASWELPDRELVAIEAGQTTVLESNVAGFLLSDDGRFLAVTFSDPPAGETARFEISDLVDQLTNGFDTPYINAEPAAWSPDGRFLIVNEQWEDGTAWVIDPWSGSGDLVFGDPLLGADPMLDGACFMSDRVIAHRTWNVGYGQGDAQPGMIRLTSLDTGSTIAEFGDDIFGDAFRCHTDGSISYLRRPVVEVEVAPGYSQLEADYDAPTELVHIATDSTTSIRADNDLRMV